MLSRIFSSNDSQGRQGLAETFPRQGSLLDILSGDPLSDSQRGPQNISADQNQQLRGRGDSLLNRMNSGFNEENQQDELLQTRFESQSSDRRPNGAEYPQPPQSAPGPQGFEASQNASPKPNSGHSGSSAGMSQAEQLDLLAQDLETQRRRKRESDNHAAENGSQSYSERPSAAAMTSHQQSFAPVQPPPRFRPPNPFSFERVIGAVLSVWKTILAFAVLGGICAALYALSLPNKYESIVEILIEPRELRILENAVSPDGLNSAATVAYAESQVRIISSSSVIDPVIEEFELMEDPEFTGAPSGGLVSQVLARIFGGKSNTSEDIVSAKQYLYENLFVSRINQTFTIQIGVTTSEPAKSARIANGIAQSYLRRSSGARSRAAGSASDDLTSRLDELKGKVRKSEESVERYRAENGLLDANGQLVSEVQLSRLNDQLTLAKVQTGDARSRAEQASQTDLSDVISGTLPSSLRNNAISQLRLEYTKTKSRGDRLATKLGQRHPDRIAAAAELRSSLGSIRQEMQRIVKSTQEDFKRAKSRQADLQRQVDKLKVSAVADSAAKVKLRELERDVAANRRVYESFLLRSRETGEEKNISSRSARVISEAVPNDKKKGPNRKLILAAGAVVGGGIGGILGLLPFLIAGIGTIAGRVSEPGDNPSQAYANTHFSNNAGSYPDGFGDLYSSHDDNAGQHEQPMSYTPPNPPHVQQAQQAATAPDYNTSVQMPLVAQVNQHPQMQPHPVQSNQYPHPAYHTGVNAPPSVTPAHPRYVENVAVQMPLPGMGMEQPMPTAVQGQPSQMQVMSPTNMQPVYVQAPPMAVYPQTQQQPVYTNWVPVEPKK